MGAQGPLCGTAERGGLSLGRAGRGLRGPGLGGWTLWGTAGRAWCSWALPACGCRVWGPGSASHTPAPRHRGTFYQGYLCTKCGVGAHKECLEVTPPCKISEYRRPPARAARRELALGHP